MGIDARSTELGILECGGCPKSESCVPAKKIGASDILKVTARATVIVEEVEYPHLPSSSWSDAAVVTEIYAISTSFIMSMRRWCGTNQIALSTII
jgi:hypothetical protein